LAVFFAPPNMLARGFSISRTVRLGRYYCTSVEQIKTVGIIGAGQMGYGIAQVTSQIANLNVIVCDNNQAQLDKGSKFMEKLLLKNVDKGKITTEVMQETISRVQGTTQLDKLAEADFIIEAVSENLNLKKNLFEQLSKITRPETILATNTSSISITKIAAATDRPEKVVGMHFMNPVPVMKLVEIIPGLATSENTLNVTLELAANMGKTTAQSNDMPGFIANRLLMPYLNEAIFALQENLGTRDDIDTTMKLGCNMPMGPLTLADFIGLDTCLAIMEVLHSQLGDSKYRPAPLLVKYVDAGWLGKKSGRGFYEY